MDTEPTTQALSFLSLPCGDHSLARKILDGTAVVDVIGLGYVGWPLAMSLSEHFQVRGHDKSELRKRQLKAFNTAIDLNGKGDAADVVIVCVPTPLSHELEGTPDPQLVFEACEQAGAYRDAPCQKLLIIESTIAPGTTRKIADKLGYNWLIAHSPERIDPGNRLSYHADCPKLVGGITHSAGVLAAYVYKFICKDVYKCETAQEAELAKLWENTFRLINISAVNEFAGACKAFGANVHRVLEAASTKPFGFMAFWPGPGAGGHCIPVDPVYLHDAAQEKAVMMPLLKQAIEINRARATALAIHIFDECRKHTTTPMSELTVLLCGETYKADVDDKRCAPTAALVHILSPVVGKLRVIDVVTGREDEGWDMLHDVVVQMVAHEGFRAPLARHVYVDATTATY